MNIRMNHLFCFEASGADTARLAIRLVFTKDVLCVSHRQRQTACTLRREQQQRMRHSLAIRYTPQYLLRFLLAIFAPGGLVILSAQAAGQLQGGVVKNSGAIEASGISQRAGRIVLDASQTLTQTSTGLVDVSGSTGGSIVLKADYDINLGGNVRAAAAEGAGGSVAVIALDSCST